MELLFVNDVNARTHAKHSRGSWGRVTEIKNALIEYGFETESIHIIKDLDCNADVKITITGFLDTEGHKVYKGEVRDVIKDVQYLGTEGTSKDALKK